MAGYDCYIAGILLPIAPEKITMKINGQNKTYHLINEGEMNILKLAGLSTVNFKILLPTVNYPFATYPNGFKQPSYFLNEFEKLKQSKKPFQFIISRHDNNTVRRNLHDTNISCSLEDYQIVEDAKSDGFDIKVEINLKQYKEFITKTFNVTTPSPTAPIALTPVRPQSTVSSGGGDSGGGGGSSGGGGGGGTTKRKYKVQIPGMSVLTIEATSIQEAITKAMGTTWTGTVYVDGVTKYVNKGKLAVDPATTKAAASTAVNTVNVTAAVKKVATAVSTVVTNVKNTLQTAVSNILNRNVLNTITNTTTNKTTTTVVKPAQTSSGSTTTSVVKKVATKNILSTK